jgi:hypothetical protein
MDFKFLSGYFLWTFLVPTISVLNLAKLLLRRTRFVKLLKMVLLLGVRSPQSSAYEVWCLNKQTKVSTAAASTTIECED